MPHNGEPAFRCKTCGHLEHAGHAGENAVPHACSVCGAGISYGPEKQKMEHIISEAGKGRNPAELMEELRRLLANPNKAADPDNWEVLADAPPERLKELGLGDVRIIRHEGHPVLAGPVIGRHIAVGGEDNGGAKDKV